jgi:hypothetical protein
VDLFSIPRHGVVFTGHDMLRASARAHAARYLVDDHGWPPAAADDATADAVLSRAWWAGPQIGFCDQHHPQAQAVNVLNIANSP